MLKNLFPEQDLLVIGGYLYLPLYLDPEIKEELRTTPAPEFSALTLPKASQDYPVILRYRQQYFIKSLYLESLLDSYAGLQPQAYEQLERHCLNKYLLRTEKLLTLLTGKLKTILFEILPHFLKVTPGHGQARVGPQEVLAFLNSRLTFPSSYLDDADKILTVVKSADLEQSLTPPSPPPAGLVTSKSLRQWFYYTLSSQILRRKKARLHQALKEAEDLLGPHPGYLPLLLFLTEAGALEINGFGFHRLGHGDDYLIYKRTGEFALKDYYGRLYLFPDCRVAVSTRDNLHPFVLDRYKHPFLLHHRAGQRICLRHFTPPTTFSARHVITALEEGLNALYHGYDYRRRNGYHSLDSLPQAVATITFEDLRLPPDHPKILSGAIEVKNDFR